MSDGPGDAGQRAEPVVLTGRRVCLRPFGSRDGDHERLVAWRSQPDIARWFASGAVVTLDSHLAWFERLRADPSQPYWAIDACRGPGTQAGPVHIGAVGLILGPGEGEAEFARYLVGDLRFRGQGHAPEAAYRLLAHAFDDLGVRRMRAEYVAGNVPVSRLYPRFGFRPVEASSGGVEESGGMVRMTLTDADFRAQQAALRRLLRLDTPPEA